MTIHPKPKPPKRAKKSAKKFIRSRSDAYRKQLERKADEMCRNIVLLRDNFCVCPAPEKGHGDKRQCGHLISRGVRSLRWDLRNVAEQCNSCNMLHEHRPERYTQWYIGKFGAGEWMKLVEDGAKSVKLSIEDMEAASLEGDYGICAAKYPVFTIRKGLRGRVKENVIYHEIAHILFPNRPHWWVECFGEKMARGGGRGYWSVKFNKTIDDLPPRSRLLELARRASRRLKSEL